MAGPSSARERGTASGVHHHHRTISSTTLLLILSLVLAVLAVMLSIPNRSGGGGVLNPEAPGSGLWGYLTPRRSQVLVARESQVALREAEVARREAELLAGQPGGLTIAACEPCPACAPIMPPPLPPLQTIIQEITREVEPLPSPVTPSIPGWWKEVEDRMETLFQRELKVSDREKEVGRREETVNRREHDAGRRETWIMEQLLNVGNQPQDVETEEIIYETRRAKPKELPPSAAPPHFAAAPPPYAAAPPFAAAPPPFAAAPPPPPPPPPVGSLRITTVTRTLYPQEPAATPAQTRVAAPPSPEDFTVTVDGRPVGRTHKAQQVVEVLEEQVVDETPSQAQPERETETIYVRERVPPGRAWW
ncbi:hypothetical protein DACRYDRAFT_23134 [Dacryopinax primogenitus]|uniref:Uncharacterized protein n=1 Tax=Dacryopinax primogenitus (strain DJM 731) TaxID=1858805 RepID=M5GA92_DACPD|nr:uncharacterized protein DACRYDRAFT_23134 [Dacryopinax primogenitus]EJU00808.1 hypothetical protein DACRYDRAFT_23134 [Dacryopinax primogenitus]